MNRILITFNDDGETHLGIEEGFKPSASQFLMIIAKVIEINVIYNTACTSSCLGCDSARKLMNAIDKFAEEFIKNDTNVQMMKEGATHKH